MRKIPLCIDPSRSAALIVDMQKGFLSPDGPVPCVEGRRIIPKLLGFLAEIRDLGVPIIWTRVTMENVRRGVYPMLWPEHFRGDGNAIMTKDSVYFEFAEELQMAVRENDRVLIKDRYSAFHQTNLELILNQMQVDTLLVAGVLTNVCVESTIRDAYHRDLIPVLISDCTATFSSEMQRATEETIGMVFGYVMAATDVVEALKRAPAAGGEP